MKLPEFIEEYPSPTDKTAIVTQIVSLKSLLANPQYEQVQNKIRIKLADLYIGRNDSGDYIEAAKIYDEILISSLPKDPEHAIAQIGKAELSLQSQDNAEIDMAIYSCGQALESLKNNQNDFFWGKGNILMAELLLKKENEKDRKAALGIYKDIASHPNVHEYFKMRAAVGKLEINFYFFRESLKKDSKKAITECEQVLDHFRVGRTNDYFFLKGKTILAEVMLMFDKKESSEKAMKILQEIANNESSGDDLRARASLDLADVSSPALAKSLIKGVRRMDGIDRYLLNKAKIIEERLSKT